VLSSEVATEAMTGGRREGEVFPRLHYLLFESIREEE
jgi:hypothetical protein